MIGAAKTEKDVERRNDEGYPIVEANVPDNRGNFHQAVDNSINKSLPWVAFSWLLSGGALIGLLVLALLLPQIIDSKVAAGVAEAKAAMAQQVSDAKVAMAQQAAEAEATALAGTQHARIALDKVELLQVQLGQKGLIKTESH